MRFMDVGRHKHHYKGFYEKFTYQISINREIRNRTQGSHESLIRIFSFLLFLLVMRFKEEVQPFSDCVDTSRG